MALAEADSLPPSKVQNHLSELFRIARGRHDDYNLASIAAVKAAKQFQTAKQGLPQNMYQQSSVNNLLASQQKILSDLQSREEKRVQREDEILKEFALMNKLSQSNFALVDKNFRKMSFALLTFDSKEVTKKSKKAANATPNDSTSLPMAETLPSQLHVAVIMAERTAQEKETFGKVELD